MATIYSTTHQMGIDINSVFMLDPSFPEYPAAPFIPGELAWGTDGSEWVYSTASITIAPGSALTFSAVPGSWSAALVSNSNRSSVGLLVGLSGGATGSVAVPAPSGTQTGSFFWAQRAGNAPNLQASATSTALTALHSSATAGALVATASVGTSVAVNGIVFSQASGSVTGPNTAILNFPAIGAND